MVSDTRRYLRHLLSSRFSLKRTFPQSTLDDIEAAIKRAEATHSGEIRFVIETALDLPTLMRGMRPQHRAVDLFAGLRVWDTAGNNGVLIYVLLAERDIEIVADRGFDGLVSADEWREVCTAMQAEFARKCFHSGALAGIADVSTIIRRYFPPRTTDINELDDRPTII